MFTKKLVINPGDRVEVQYRSELSTKWEELKIWFKGYLWGALSFGGVLAIIQLWMLFN